MFGVLAEDWLVEHCQRPVEACGRRLGIVVYGFGTVGQLAEFLTSVRRVGRRNRRNS